MLLKELEENKLIEMGRGKIISKDEIAKKPGSFPVYSSSAQGDGRIGAYGEYMFDSEMITWSIDGGGKLFYRDKHFYSVTNVCGWLKVNNKDFLNTKYLYYNLIHEWKKSNFDYTFKAHPSVIKNKYNIIMRNINEQKQISQKLTHIHDSIAYLKSYIVYYDELVKSRFIEMFGKMTADKTIGEIATICRGASPRPISKYITNGDGENWIKIGDVQENDIFITRTAEKVTKAGADKSRRVKPGDFILSNSMSFGRPYILGINGCVHDGWLIISNYQNSYDAIFFYYLLRSNDVQSQFDGSANGSCVRNLNSDLVRNVKVITPSLELQKQFVDFAKLIDKSKYFGGTTYA